MIAPFSCHGRVMSGEMMSTPATSSAKISAARRATRTFSGWMMAVTSSSCPPQAVVSIGRNGTNAPAAGTDDGPKPLAAST